MTTVWMWELVTSSAGLGVRERSIDLDAPWLWGMSRAEWAIIAFGLVAMLLFALIAFLAAPLGSRPRRRRNTGDGGDGGSWTIGRHDDGGEGSWDGGGGGHGGGDSGGGGGGDGGGD